MVSTHQADGHGGNDELLQAAEELLRPPVVEEASALRRANLQSGKKDILVTFPQKRANFFLLLSTMCYKRCSNKRYFPPVA